MGLRYFNAVMSSSASESLARIMGPKEDFHPHTLKALSGHNFGACLPAECELEGTRWGSAAASIALVVQDIMRTRLGHDTYFTGGYFIPRPLTRRTKTLMSPWNPEDVTVERYWFNCFEAEVQRDFCCCFETNPKSFCWEGGVFSYDLCCPEHSNFCARDSAIASPSVRAVFAEPETGPSLRFLHIPKNAGCSIADVALAHGERWSMHKMSAMPYSMPDGSTCPLCHVPPYLYPGDYYSKGEVFCVVRDPLDRSLSRFRHATYDKEIPAHCSVAFLNEWIRRQVGKVLVHRFHADCHFTPQVDFVYDPTSGESTCHHILRMTSLEVDFGGLMQRYGYGFSLDRRDNYHPGVCPDLSKGDFETATVDLIREVYREDYELLRSLGPDLHARSRSRR